MALSVSCMPTRAPGDDHAGLVASAVGSGESVRAYEAKPNFMIISRAVRTIGLARHKGLKSLWWPGKNACRSAKAFRELALVMEGFRGGLADYPALLSANSNSAICIGRCNPMRPRDETIEITGHLGPLRNLRS